jgi:8-oxo-dGTP pyrophosphatase MutT (NUDIX family)
MLLEDLLSFGSCGQQITDFIENNPTDWWLRSNTKGHIVGSAFIMDKTRTYTLLTHHTKLNKWLQLGGHCDISDVLETAHREANEESGISNISIVSMNIFDVDIHAIPGGKEPEHIHYDIRYLFEADIDSPIIVSSESKDVKWIRLDEVQDYNSSENLMRMVRKINQL